MDNTSLVNTVSNTGRLLDGINNLGHIRGNRSRFRVWHPGAKDTAETADQWHHVRSGNEDIEVTPAALNLGDKVFCADFIRASNLCSLCLSTTCKDSNLLGFAGAVRQIGGSTDNLITLTWVHTEADSYIDGGVELR